MKEHNWKYILQYNCLCLNICMVKFQEKLRVLETGFFYYWLLILDSMVFVYCAWVWYSLHLTLSVPLFLTNCEEDKYMKDTRQKGTFFRSLGGLKKKPLKLKNWKLKKLKLQNLKFLKQVRILQICKEVWHRSDQYDVDGNRISEFSKKIILVEGQIHAEIDHFPCTFFFYQYLISVLLLTSLYSPTLVSLVLNDPYW